MIKDIEKVAIQRLTFLNIGIGVLAVAGGIGWAVLWYLGYGIVNGGTGVLAVSAIAGHFIDKRIKSTLARIRAENGLQG